MFYECEDSDIENHTDDTTPYACASDININTVISELQVTASKLFTWLATITWKQTIFLKLTLVEPW